MISDDNSEATDQGSGTAFFVALLRRHDNLAQDPRQLASFIEQGDTPFSRTEIPRGTGSQPAH